MNLNIYCYTDFGVFLQNAKSSLENITYDQLAEELELKSRTHAKKVFKGQLPCPEKALKPLARLLGLSDEEHDYLQLLRAFYSTQKAEVASNVFGKILLERSKYLEEKFTSLVDGELRLLEKWFCLPLLYYFRLVGSKADSLEISRDFSGDPSAKEIEEGIAILVELGFIQQANGQFLVCKDELVLFDGLPRNLVKRFHSLMLERALASIHAQSVDQRYLLSASLNIPLKSVPKIRSRIEDFFKQLNQEFCMDDASDSIHQLNIQMFEVAKILPK